MSSPSEVVVPALADPSARVRLPGEPGIWIFVLIDMSVFALLFLAYVVGQAQQPDVFGQSQRILDLRMGLANTLVLLTSSWLVALAVSSAKRGGRAAAPLVVAGALCGCVFVVVKCFEYREKFVAGYSMLTNDFFMYYFIVTFIHFIHVIVGIIALWILSRMTIKQGAGPTTLRWLETGATYWHMVDLLWVMIFPLFYLVSWQ